MDQTLCPHHLVNARLAYTTDTYTAAAYVKNIADQYYNVYGINTESFAFNDYFIRGEPRTYGVELSVRF